MKLAACIPYHGHVPARFAIALAQCIAVTSKEAETIILGVESSDIAQNRNELILLAIRNKPDWIAWLDADHIFPPDALIHLLSRNLDVVGANYRTRNAPQRPTAFKNGAWLETTADSPPIEEVDSLGMGLCLIRAAALYRLLDEKRAGWPLFAFTEENGQRISEDVHFFRKLKRAGIKVHVDHDLSKQVGHISESILRF